jgi:hypothetical protein
MQPELAPDKSFFVRKHLNKQFIAFMFGLMLFLVSAYFGWEKLYYGFSFLDEGFHMTDSWRLSVGDHFIKDELVRNNLLYPLINSYIFKFAPEITLLEFRKLAFIAAIFALSIFSVSLYVVDRTYWYQPMIFSFFAFSGFEPIGLFTNLNYYSYPHLFLTLHVSFFIVGVYQANQLARRVLLAVSGFFLWAISFSVLHLSLVVLAPVLAFVISNTLKLRQIYFKFIDLGFVVAPCLLCWLLFISIHQKAYLMSILAAVDLNRSTASYSYQEMVGINWELVKHMTVLIPILGMVFVLLKKRFKVFVTIIGLTALSVMIFFIINTSFFSLIKPYYFGWFDRPMWFAASIIFIVIYFWIGIIKKAIRQQKIGRGEQLALILLIPSTILLLSSSVFSGLGVLTALHSSIPVVAAITILIISTGKIRRTSYVIKMSIVMLLFFPFYSSCAWSDWKFTYFDVFPEHANVTIERGFGRGIKTNAIYLNLYEWIINRTHKYTRADDFVLSYTVSPMVYMIAKRRPALDHSWTSIFAKPHAFFVRSIQKMIKHGRQPKLAFVFESWPGFYPESLNRPKYLWYSREFNFPGHDPISAYIINNMELVEEYIIYQDVSVKLFRLRRPANPAESLFGLLY